ncbi:MAG: NAD(P)/FAD-dependent oxidoreductase [Dehalococcoidia bacterium]
MDARRPPPAPPSSRTERPHIVVVGGGFAGLAVVRGLARAPVRITLVDRSNHHLFQPLLYQVATGSLSPANVAAPLRGLLRRQRNVRVLLAEVDGIDPDARIIRTEDADIAYDMLVLATGARHDYFGQQWADLAPGLKTIADATEIRRRILTAFERAEVIGDELQARDWLTFAVVGGGPTGVELAGALAEIARSTLRDEFRSIRPASARILLLEGGDRILPAYPESLTRKALEALRRLGVSVHLNTRVVDVGEDSVTVRQGEARVTIPARTVLWAAGVRASRLGRALAASNGCKVDRAGRLLVTPDLTLPGYPEVSVIGDLAHVRTPDGAQLPGLASVALQQGQYAARAISGRLGGERPEPFRYRDRGTMAVVGRGFAVADLRSLQLSGFPGWVVWALFHLAQIVEFENRILVLVQWLWSYWTWKRAARLIIGRPRTPVPAPADSQPPPPDVR